MAAIAYVILLFFITVPPCFSAYDYMMFSLQWPMTVCMFSARGPCTVTPNQFTIHGLWPNNITGNQPAYCTTEAFDWNLITQNLPEMFNMWPDLYGNEWRFWRGEWRKHGTCASIYFDQLGYFTTALATMSRVINIDFEFAQNNIFPGATFSLATVVGAIRNVLHVNPEIACDGPGFTYLKEIRICLDQPAVQFKDCPNAARTRCNSILYLPS